MRKSHGWWRRNWLLGIGAALACGTLLFAAAACGDDDDDDASPGTPVQTEEPTAEQTEGAEPTEEASNPGGLDYGELSGEIRIDGSSTVYPISEAMAEEFGQVSDVRVNVAFSGTGGGFERFCRGETEVSDASRAIRDSELEACAANGIDDVLELNVAIDALTLVVHPDNDWATCMTVDEVYQAFASPDTGGAERWSDIRADWPDEPLVTYYPGTDSGTFDYFVEAIIEGARDEEGNHRSDGTASEDDNILVLGVENDRNSIGYFGFAYYLEAGENLKAVQIDGGNGCVEPTYDNALAGTYTPLSRPLFIYTRTSFLEERPEVLGFIDFYVRNIEQLVPEVGYISLPAEDIAEQMAKIEAYLP